MRHTGGTKVIRCEISLDDGKTWRLAEISRFEQPNWADKHWCWVHYSLEVPIGAPRALITLTGWQCCNPLLNSLLLTCYGLDLLRFS